MTPKSKNNGLSLLGKLDRFWMSHTAPQPKFASNERLIRISSEHWIKYVLPSILYFLLTAIAFFLLSLSVQAASSMFGFFVFFISGILLLTCVHHWFFWYVLAESQACIILTSKRVVHIRQGLLWRQQTIDVAFEKMKTVEAHKKTLLQSLLNYGTLQFEPMVKIRRTPHPGTLARQIEQAMGLI